MNKCLFILERIVIVYQFEGIIKISELILCQIIILNELDI